MSEDDLSNLNILVVDDEAFILNLSVRILNKLGCDKIETANNGAHALELIDKSNTAFDIIICDLNMPEMDGIEFMRHAADKKVTSGMILLSGEDERMLETARDLAKAHKLNILGVIPKPLKPDAIKDLLESFKPAEQKKTWTPQAPITEDELREGMNGDGLQLVYQPKVRITDGQVTGVETLARWNHKERGILGPGAFIPLAEQTGLIHDLTYAIHKKAMTQQGEWLANGIDMKVSVNISVNSFSLENFSDFLMNTALEQGVDLSRVVIEVTESQVMSDPTGCLEIMMKLRMKKMGLSIDDFGTGNSSMEQLKRIPFTELKIDRAFVYGAVNDSGARAILESSVTLAKSLKMETVAEGAENREDWDLVESLGVDLVQGYYCAKPMPNEQFLEFLENWTGPH
jgi:EAL domain-containing protein (putative c-di-GMP-specific phosphodiesterase class I)/ActR/RegA family two-component response regulator